MLTYEPSSSVSAKSSAMSILISTTSKTIPASDTAGPLESNAHRVAGWAWSLTAKTVLLAVIFVLVPVFLYVEFRSADQDSQDLLLRSVGLGDRMDHYPVQLSGGEQQRVALARAFILRPPIVLADEPTGNLDSNNGNEVMQLLTDLNEHGTTIVMVTHSEHDARYSHRIIRMLDGQTVLENIMI